MPDPHLWSLVLKSSTKARRQCPQRCPHHPWLCLALQGIVGGSAPAAVNGGTAHFHRKQKTKRNREDKKCLDCNLQQSIHIIKYSLLQSFATSCLKAGMPKLHLMWGVSRQEQGFGNMAGCHKENLIDHLLVRAYLTPYSMFADL